MDAQNTKYDASFFYAKNPELLERNKQHDALAAMTQLLLDSGYSKDEVIDLKDGRFLDIVYRLSRLK
ncbi:hypothetical protein [Agrobacterium rosae]|uniref:Uncharacterized protein n=1 Tax=Agrobacterium rosae TaxID=1972867 RepID=A0AAE5VML0_9HYPH|nr:hypothetical protein [Agrobacterium rosae]KAA3511607.1 hypothetical protein DXM21_14270 [Agrobacterium rosae]KAA3518969.1 hypothetical protein DXM25_13745 [Agrobacterium rosae]MQB49303.1 hypothetical protein [Agrobacterium rosae]POO49145.1 hypothetical protein CPJ18_22095 [Agrobacterium rosae]